MTRRPGALTLYERYGELIALPTKPAAGWMFWPDIAERTSDTEMPSASIFIVSSHTRIAYSLLLHDTDDTPGTRWSASFISWFTKFPSATRSISLQSVVKRNWIA